MSDAISTDPNRYGDTHAIAELTSLSVDYLKQLRVKGGGPAFSRIGVAVRYRIGDVQAWMASKSVTSTSQREAA